MARQKTFAEFWPEYVRAHEDAKTRLMHFTGTAMGWALLVVAIVTRRWWLMGLALLVPYAAAWVSHFFVEHNKPASFEHPWWSWVADQKMVSLMLVGKMEPEVKKAMSAL